MGIVVYTSISKGYTVFRLLFGGNWDILGIKGGYLERHRLVLVVGRLGEKRRFLHRPGVKIGPLDFVTTPQNDHLGRVSPRSTLRFCRQIPGYNLRP